MRKNNNNNYRKYLKLAVLVCLTVFIGLGFFYIIGLIQQAITNYMEWNANGGFINSELIKPVDWDIWVCMGYAFSVSGLKLTLIVLIGVGCVIFYFKYKDKLHGKKCDPRGFVISKDGTRGTAEIMNDNELKSILRKGNVKDADGIILGSKNGKAIWVPKDTGLNGHIAVFGASGSMKSRAIVRNTLFQSIKSGESVVVTDLKGELYEDTAILFEENGYKVRVLNLANLNISDTWNCLSIVQENFSIIHTISKVIMENTRTDGKVDQFWEAAEDNLLNALLLYVCNDKSRKEEEKNMSAVYDLLVNSSETELIQMFEMYRKKTGSNQAFEIYKKSVEKVRSGALTGLAARLGIWQSKDIKELTGSSDIDLTDPAKEKCAYFVRLQDVGSSFEVLSSLFFSCLFIELSEYIANHPQNSTLPVNFILDEFNNIGQIGGNNGLDFAKTISTCRSKKIKIMLASQGLGQLKNRYPKEIWSEILGNCDVQLLLGCNDLLTAEYFSACAGEMSVENDAYMTNRKTFAIAQVVPDYRQTQSTVSRKVLMPDEIRRLPTNQLMCLIRGHNVLILDKLDYTEHPFANLIRQAKLNEYKPKRMVAKQEQYYLENHSKTPCGYAEISARKISCTGSKPPEDF